jgi:hypothetical protein
MMTDELRRAIYLDFDQNGIPGQHLSVPISGIVGQYGEITMHDPHMELKADLLKYGITNKEDIEQIIIDYVYDTTNFKILSVNELMNMRLLEGKPFFLLLNEYDRNNLKYSLAFSNLPGSVVFRDSDKIDSLGNIKKIDGDLGFSDCNVKDLGQLKIIEGSFWIAQSGKGIFTQIKSLVNLEYVGKDFNMKNSPIANLSNLMHVGGNLNLRKAQVKSLGKLKYIGGNLLLSKSMKGVIDISRVRIGGKAKYFTDN